MWTMWNFEPTALLGPILRFSDSRDYNTLHCRTCCSLFISIFFSVGCTRIPFAKLSELEILLADSAESACRNQRHCTSGFPEQQHKGQLLYLDREMTCISSHWHWQVHCCPQAIRIVYSLACSGLRTSAILARIMISQVTVCQWWPEHGLHGQLRLLSSVLSTHRTRRNDPLISQRKQLRMSSRSTFIMWMAFQHIHHIWHFNRFIDFCLNNGLAYWYKCSVSDYPKIE